MATEGRLIIYIAKRHLCKQEKKADIFLFNGLYGMLTVLLPLTISRMTVGHDDMRIIETEALCEVA